MPAMSEKRLKLVRESVEEAEFLFGATKFRGWLRRRDAARSPSSRLSRVLSWRVRAAILSSLGLVLSPLVFWLVGERPWVGLLVGVFLAVVTFAQQALWYNRFPEQAPASSVADLLWTIVVVLIVGALVAAFVLMMGVLLEPRS